MVRFVRTVKRPYTAPSFQVLDINTVKAKLGAKIITKDRDARQLLELIEKQPAGKSRNPKTN